MESAVLAFSNSNFLEMAFVPGPPLAEGLAQDIVEAKERTLFFAHLMTPHRPYVFHKNVRNFSAWMNDDIDPVPNAQAYADKYLRYAEQVEHLCDELDWFFRYLQEHQAFDSMLVIIHGDHGSRIRLLDGRAQEKPEQLPAGRLDFGRYDYSSRPQPQDLLNRFSALLAIKERGARNYEIVQESGSLLRFLNEAVYHNPGGLSKGIDSVYLFDAAGMPLEIPFAEFVEASAERWHR